MPRDAGTPAATAPTPTPVPVRPHIVRPPPPGTKRFITVQIDPAEQRSALATLPTFVPVSSPRDAVRPGGGGNAASGARYGWFWRLVGRGGQGGASLPEGASAARFARALSALRHGPGGAHVPPPPPGLLADVARRYGKLIAQATAGRTVSPALVVAVIGVESAGDPHAVSRAGARGLMQLMPATARRFGVGDSFDPAQNIGGGVAYLDWLLQRFNGDALSVLAAYNAGENADGVAAGLPAPVETRDYVPKVLAAWQVAQNLCATPPRTITGACHFRVASAQN